MDYLARTVASFRNTVCQTGSATCVPIALELPAVEQLDCNAVATLKKLAASWTPIVSSMKEVELKGGMYTFMSLKLQTTNLEIISEQLASKVQQAPSFFKDTPVVVDLSFLDSTERSIEGQPSVLNGKDLLDCIRSHNLLPIVASVSNKSSPLAASIALPLIEGGARRQSSSDVHSSVTSGVPSEKTQPSASAAVTGAGLALTATEVEYVIKAPMLVNRPVRSGQQIYARDTDLIVMGSIGAGAEVIADCNIHVYGPLRGKALCGVSGNTETRIFCQSLEAELVSVAGNYRLLEEIPEDLRGKPAQIWLDKDRLNIEPL